MRWSLQHGLARIRRISKGVGATRLASRVDRLELIESMVFGFFFVSSWNASTELLKAGRSVGRHDRLAVAGTGVAIALMAVQGMFMLKYASSTPTIRISFVCS